MKMLKQKFDMLCHLEDFEIQYWQLQEENKQLKERMKNNSVMKCCICNNEKIGQFITIDNKKYHLCCIKQLKERIEYLERGVEEYQKALDETMSEKMDIENNWNKLKEYAKENLYFYSGYQGEDLETDVAIHGVLDKMQELEGSDKNERN